MERMTYRPKSPFVSKTTGKLIKAFCDTEDVREIIHRLADYEDTGMTPEAFQSYVVFLQDLIGNQKASEALDRFRQLVKADKDGRLVVLGHPRRRVMWGDVEPDRLLCPECGNDLAGGFTEQASANLEMVNCPYCGEYLNLGRKTEAEKALEAMKDE